MILFVKGVVLNMNEIATISGWSYRDSNGLSRDGAEIRFRDGSEICYRCFKPEDLLEAKEIPQKP